MSRCYYRDDYYYVPVCGGGVVGGLISLAVIGFYLFFAAFVGLASTNMIR